MPEDLDTRRLLPRVRARPRLLRACLDCGRPCAGPRCPDHNHGTTTTDRGYGNDHQKTRARLLTQAIGQPCPLCSQPMLASQALELDHSTPLAEDRQAIGDRIVHATCNRARR